jgi:hypothetical protein
MAKIESGDTKPTSAPPPGGEGEAQEEHPAYDPEAIEALKAAVEELKARVTDLEAEFEEEAGDDEPKPRGGKRK